MIKQNKWNLLISSIVILLPILFGLVFWNDLPEQMTTHWGIDGTADGWSERAVAVFALPLFILAVHWLCVFCTAKDPRNKGQNRKVFRLVLWIIPMISLFTNGMMYAVSFGKEIQPYFMTNLLLGVAFVVIGNYLPKCKQNYTIGIKVKWTLENEENWNATHRFGGKVWVIGGLLLLSCVFLPERMVLWVTIPAMLVLVIIPIIYSWQYHKKQVRAGNAVITPLPQNKAGKMIALSRIAAVLIFVGIIMFTGDIGIRYLEHSFVIEASYWHDLTVDYNVIEYIEYRDYDNRGVRTYGFGSARLLAGTFHNEEFGDYTRYSYTRCDACVVLTVGDKILVVNGPDEECTRAIYEQITSNLE